MTHEQIDAAEIDAPIRNGQVWEQVEFPYFKFLVLLTPEKPGSFFCRLSITHKPYLITTEESGQWLYTEKDLRQLIQKCNFTITDKVLRATSVETGTLTWAGEYEHERSEYG